MSLDPATLMVSFVVSVIGFYYFREGKKDSDIRVILAGVSMIGYSYFVSGLLMNIIIGVALWGLAHAFRKGLL